MTRRSWSLAAVLLLTTAANVTLAQDVPVPDGTPLPAYARRIDLTGATPVAPPPRGAGSLPVIVITGYWPPTNEMIRRFSADPAHNPDGWIGGNWEGRGYDIYAFFPEFPGGVLNKGQGDFEVDYQDTSADWWNIIPSYHPIAMITFSRAGNDSGWEFEGGNRTYIASQWTADYLTPTRPTPELPIMIQEPALTERFSTLPITQMIADVQASGAAVNAFSTVIDNGRFLSNFIGYHGCWYRVLHGAVSDPDWLICSGHIHVGYAMSLATAITATEATLRSLTTYVDKRRLPGDMNCDGYRNGDDVQAFVQAMLSPAAYAAAFPACVLKNGDYNGDELVTIADVDLFSASLVGM